MRSRPAKLRGWEVVIGGEMRRGTVERGGKGEEILK